MLTVPRETGCWKTGSVRGLEERICQRMETFFNLRILVKALLCALYPARTSGCVPLGTYAASGTARDGVLEDGISARAGGEDLPEDGNILQSEDLGKGTSLRLVSG